MPSSRYRLMRLWMFQVSITGSKFGFLLRFAAGEILAYRPNDWSFGAHNKHRLGIAQWSFIPTAPHPYCRKPDLIEQPENFVSRIQSPRVALVKFLLAVRQPQ